MAAEKKLTPYVMLAPYFILYFIFGLFPIIFSFGISLTRWDGFSDISFAGLANYIRVFTQDKFFYESLRNTVIFMLFNIPMLIFLGLIIATLLKDHLKKLREPVQLINFLPYITTPVAIGMIFQQLFERKGGVVNAFLELINLEPIYWLGEVWPARFVVIFMNVWQGYGYIMVLFLAGLSTIPDELYEAAKMDGAKWRHVFFKITIPMLRPIFTFVVTTSVINGFRLFDQPQLLFQSAFMAMGGPERAGMTVVMRFYEASFMQFEFGYGSAMAYCLFIIIAIVSYLLVKVLNRDNQS
jgi:ABC-type sugar transport system permease subunit